MKHPILLGASFFLLVACNHEITPGQIAEGPRPIDPNAIVSGTVETAPGIQIKGSGSLFIISRKADKPFGPPLAVKNVSDPILPLEFRLSQANVMMQSNIFSGTISLTARFDRDGNPMTTAAGDIVADLMPSVKVGTTGIKLILNKVVE